MNMSNMTPAQQARALGLQVGDTIEGVHNGCTARLTLLWLGESVAVWRVTEQFHPAHGWTRPVEKANWTLDCRSWVKISSEPPRISDEKANDALQQTLIKSCNYAFAHNQA